MSAERAPETLLFSTEIVDSRVMARHKRAQERLRQAKMDEQDQEPRTGDDTVFLFSRKQPFIQGKQNADQLQLTSWHRELDGETVLHTTTSELSQRLRAKFREDFGRDALEKPPPTELFLG